MEKTYIQLKSTGYSRRTSRCSWSCDPKFELPVDLAFLRGIDLFELDALVIKKDLHIIEEKLVRIRIRNIESEVVDKLFLLSLPFRPAILAHLGADLCAQFGRDRSVTDGFVFLPAAAAFEFVA